MSKAFSLLELLVVIAIMSIFMGVGVVTYTGSIQQKNLQKVTDDLTNLLTLSKERTIRRDISLNPTCANFRGYDVQITASNPTNFTYRLRMICRVSGADVFQPIVNHTFTAPNASVVTPLTSVSFYYPFGCLDPTYNAVDGVSDSDCANTAEVRSITIKSLKNKCITIDVNSLGVVSSFPEPCP